MSFSGRHGGQVALLDGMLFFTVVLVASSLLTSYSMAQFSAPTDRATSYRFRYIEITGSNLFGSTIKETYYFDINQNKVILDDYPICDLIVLDLAGREAGINPNSFAELESAIKLRTTDAISHDFHYAIQTKYNTKEQIYISDQPDSQQVFNDIAPKFSYNLLKDLPFDMPGTVIITLSIWPD